jgi:GMP synthase (glutamine-hydrolysing)
MSALMILKAGTTFPNTARQFGDFDLWTAEGLGCDRDAIRVVDVEQGESLPTIEECDGVVVTGSHAMVTDDRPWNRSMTAFIQRLVEARVPFLGICYGHQFLAQALGGRVGFHPGGEEIGSVQVNLSPESSTDSLFHGFPSSFPVHVTHEQTVLSLPSGAVHLAANSFEPNHAFRIGACAWGVQFHPEYSMAIMKSYIEEQATELETAGRDVAELLRNVVETPVAAAVLRRFALLVWSGAQWGG